MAWFFLMFRVGQLITDSQGRAGALRNHKIAFADPRGILFVNIAVRHVFFELKYLLLSDMFCEDVRGLVNVIDHVPVKGSVGTASADGSGKIDFLSFRHIFLL